MFLPDTLEPLTYPAVQEWMLGTDSRTDSWYIEKTYTYQQARVLQSRPDTYLFTAYSAVPVADAVRGYYAALDLTNPRLGFIRADTTASRNELLRAERLTNEARRLASTVTASDTVCIVDQYIASRGSVKLAIAILESLGVTRIETMEGRWYHDANADCVDLENVTSYHADFFYRLGAMAAA